MRELIVQEGKGVAEGSSKGIVQEMVAAYGNENPLEKKIISLRSMGFYKAAKMVDSARRLTMAYDQYTYISKETVNKFNGILRKDTLCEDKKAREFKQLVFMPIEKYGQVPPDHVLTAMGRAVEQGIFDRFVVAKIQWIKEIKDPIVFGRIDGCSDYFYIAQWDDDVRIEDILKIA